jgi:CBS domain-containing protein
LKLAVILVMGIVVLALAPFCMAQTGFSPILYGKVVDENGNPVANETITLEWEEDERQKSTSTRTLTHGEAILLKNTDLAGTYIFKKSEIDASPGTELTIKTQPRVAYKKTIFTSQGNMEAEPIMIPGLAVKVTEVHRENLLRKAFQTVAVFIRWIFLKTFKLAIIAALLYFFWKYIWKAFRKGKNSYLAVKTQLSSKVTAFSRKKVKSVMTRNVVTMQRGSGILETLETMITKGVNCIVVVSKKKPIGVVSECDFLKKVYTRDSIEPLKVEDIMSSPVKSISLDSCVFEAVEFALANNIRRVPVIKNGKLEGIISMSDVLREMDIFFSQNVLESDSLPAVSEFMAREVNEISDEARLSDVLSYMIFRKTSYYLVSDKKNLDSKKIVTSSDVLSHFYKNLNDMYSLKLKQITSTPVIFVKSNANVLHCLEMMKDNDFRRLPVVEGNKVVGVVTQLMLVKSLHGLMKRLAQSGK